jgi:hypothetical protein
MSPIKKTARSVNRTANWQPAKVVSINGGRVSVRVSVSGAILHDLKVIGVVTEINQKVMVDLRATEPIVLSFDNGFKAGPIPPIYEKAKTMTKFSRAGNQSGSVIVFSNPPHRLEGIIVDNAGQAPVEFACNESGLSQALSFVDPGGAIYIPGGIFPTSCYCPSDVHMVGSSPGLVKFTSQFTAGSGCTLESITIQVEGSGNQNLAAMLFSGPVVMKNCDVKMTRISGVGHTSCTKATANESELFARECHFISNGDTVWGNHTGVLEMPETYTYIRDSCGYGSWNSMHQLIFWGYNGITWGAEPKGFGMNWWPNETDGGWFQANKYRINIPGAQRIYSWAPSLFRQKTGCHYVEHYHYYCNVYGVNTTPGLFPTVWTNDGWPNWLGHLLNDYWWYAPPRTCWIYRDHTVYEPYLEAWAGWSGGGYMGAGWHDLARVTAHIKDSNGQDWSGDVWSDGEPAGYGETPDINDWDLVNLLTDMIFVNCIFEAGPGHTALNVRGNATAYVVGCEIPSYSGRVYFLQGDRATFDGSYHAG